ncbi:hypothetical protein BC831DRAFT_468669, partial [Entophlyctis helioformis]
TGSNTHCRILSVLVSIRLSFLAVCMSMTAESTCMASEISWWVKSMRAKRSSRTSLILARRIFKNPNQLPVVLVPASMDA